MNRNSLDSAAGGPIRHLRFYGAYATCSIRWLLLSVSRFIDLVLLRLFHVGPVNSSLNSEGSKVAKPLVTPSVTCMNGITTTPLFLASAQRYVELRHSIQLLVSLANGLRSKHCC